MQYSHISSLAVVTTALRAFNIQSTATKYDAIEWIGDCIELIGYYRGFKSTCCLMPVDFHKISKPIDMFMFDSMTYNGERLNYGRVPNTNKSSSMKDPALMQVEILLRAKPQLEALRDRKISNPDANIVGPYSIDYLNDKLDNFDSYIEGLYQHAKNGSICTNQEEYFWDDDSCWGTSIDSGHVLIWYNAFMRDKQGFPMIVNEIKYKTALEYYIMKKLTILGHRHPTMGLAGIMTLSDRSILAASNQHMKFTEEHMSSFMNKWTNLLYSIKYND